MSKYVIHIGANKTGSTTLQRWLFSKFDNINYLGEDCQNYDELKDVLNSLVSDDEIFFDQSKARDLFSKKFLNDDSKVNLFSNEDIMRSRNPSQCAQRLADLMPGAKILMVIRNQLTAIPSWYANHGTYLRNVPSYYWRRYVSFEDWMEYCTQFIERGPLAGFFYKKHADLWARYFGKENVKILLFEDLAHNKEKFIKQVSETLNIDPVKALKIISGKHERKRYTLRMHRFHKINSRFLRGVPIGGNCLGDYIEKVLRNYLNRGPKFDNFIQIKWQEKIVDLYKGENSALSHEYDLPLKKIGYPVS